MIAFHDCEAPGEPLEDFMREAAEATEHLEGAAVYHVGGFCLVDVATEDDDSQPDTMTYLVPGFRLAAFLAWLKEV